MQIIDFQAIVGKTKHFHNYCENNKQCYATLIRTKHRKRNNQPGHLKLMTPNQATKPKRNRNIKSVKKTFPESRISGAHLTQQIIKK